MKRRWRWGAALVGLPLAAYGLATLMARPARRPPVLAALGRRPLVIAHRGGEGLWPRNTLYAFQQAAALGVDMLEMDIHASADGVLVVRHDDTVDSTTEGSGLVKAMTLAQLKQLDAGYRWSGDGGRTTPFRGQGITIPTLEEVFAALPDMPMTIEIKQAEPSIAEKLCALIHAYGRQDRVIVGSFHPGALDEFRRCCPQVATSAHEDDVRTFVTLSRTGLIQAYSPRPVALQVPQRHGDVQIVSRRSVEHAHRRGLEVHVWTVNEVEEMAALIELGVDGIITDFPDKLMALLER